MTDSVSFKAYLKRDGQEVEVRRFGIDGGAATSYMYLRSKIQAMFPIIPNDQFQVFWQDNDKDYIRVDSDEELLEALTLSNQQPLKIYIRVENTSNSQGGPTGSSSGSGGQHQHSGVVCDGCEGAVTGFRYKCVTCPDYDLCSRCESNGLHTEHFMLRMPTPVSHFQHHPKFLRKMFSHPHKFHKRHGWSRPSPPPRGCGDSQNGPRRCPFSRQGEAPGISFAGLPDMFDFSALMEFIESLSSGVEDPSNQGTSAATAPGVAPTATASNAFQNSQAPSSSQNQAQEPSRPQHERSSATTYLNNIGQMVAAILDPLGIPAERKQQAAKKIVKKIQKLDKCGLKKGMGHGVHGFKKHHHLHHKHHGHGNYFKHGSGLNKAFRPKCGHSPKNGQNNDRRNMIGHGITHGPGIAHGNRMGRGLRHGVHHGLRGQIAHGNIMGRGLRHGVHHGHRGHRVGPRFNNGRNRHGSGPSPSHREVGSADILIVDDSDIEIVFEDVAYW